LERPPFSAKKVRKVRSFGGRITPRPSGDGSGNRAVLAWSGVQPNAGLKYRTTGPVLAEHSHTIQILFTGNREKESVSLGTGPSSQDRAYVFPDADSTSKKEPP